MRIYYDSRTGNVFRFIHKLKKVFEANNTPVEFIKITDFENADTDGHLITYTAGFGEISKVTNSFLEREDNAKHILSVSSSGNMNWGENYAKASALISKYYDIPVILNFELSGTAQDAQNYYEKLMQFDQ